MQIMIKEILRHEPIIINGVHTIKENPDVDAILFNGVNEEDKPFSYFYPKNFIEYFRKVGD